MQYLSYTFSGFPFPGPAWQKEKKRRTQDWEQSTDEAYLLPFTHVYISATLLQNKVNRISFTFLLLICAFMLFPFSSSEKLIVQRRSNSGFSLFIPFFTLFPQIVTKHSQHQVWFIWQSWGHHLPGSCLQRGLRDGIVNHLWKASNKRGEEVSFLEGIVKHVPFLGNKHDSEGTWSYVWLTFFVLNCN